MTRQSIPRELLLLRHGKSDWSQPVEDTQRPLKKRGKLGAQRMGAWLAQAALVPEAVLASPALRARVSAEKCLKAMGETTDGLETDPALYHGTPEMLVARIVRTPDTIRRLMLVGHNPDLEDLLHYLLPEPPALGDDGKLLPTASLVRLAIDGSWSHLALGGARLVEIRRARKLPTLFPFPFPDGPERRERPAYYYVQSAVVPYRVHQGQLEVLVIGSSSNRHWSLPKGIAEPGLSLHESARKEALEEAGIEGDIDASALGRYHYQKWGGSCEVTVFPMRVTRQLADEALEEPHRARQWMAAERAAECLRQPSLGAMVHELLHRLKAASAESSSAKRPSS
ncbi:phosphohistidine phosphatase [Onishia taeanensis]|uniref:Phosphohistidine phosphatase n=1 Tax=Onishia taeanensis TaxID=284577 RepID=A0A328XNT8_9GAMM|nr:NUDIX domain-containing protein [Halomonas taeanensis]RAR61463.1 phosphohistidine phosphatase [Halomonas taeanensis]